MILHAEGKKPQGAGVNYPSVNDGLLGVQFIETCVASSQDNEALGLDD